MSTITAEQEVKIAETVSKMHLPSGLGDEENACTVAAVNLALTGRLTDNIPDCMSLVIGRWVIKVQDSMPDSMRNSKEWKNLIPAMAGTGRNHEQERAQIILGWMWDTVLPVVQPTANNLGFGVEWQTMLLERTAAAANAAAYAAAAANAAAANAAANAAAYAAAYAAANAAANAAYAAADAAANAAAWNEFSPAKLLAQLVAVGN